MKNFVPSEFSILIVDDDPENLKLLSNMLVKVGYNLSFTKNSQEARHKISYLQPDLILLDLKQLEYNGYREYNRSEVCNELRQDVKHQDIPIILMTLSQEREDLNYAFDFGAIDYVQKPFQHKEVLARVKTHLTIKKRTEELKQSEAQLNSIITHLYDGILIVDRDGIVQFANPAAARIFAQPLEALFNHSLGIPILTSDKALLDFIYPNGKLGVAEITVGKTKWQGETVDIICLRDISDRQQAMQELEAALNKQQELSE